MWKKESHKWFERRKKFGSIKNPTGVEDSSVDPTLSVADGHLAGGVAQQNVCAASPGSGRHTIGVVTSPVAH